MYLSKHTLIKIVLLLFLHQFTESERNFLLLETQFLIDGGKGVKTWRKYHNQVTWQPCGERLHPKGRCTQANERIRFTGEIYIEKSNHQWKIMLCNSVRNLARKIWLLFCRKDKGPQAKILGWGGIPRWKENFAVGYQVIDHALLGITAGNVEVFSESWPINSHSRSINKLSDSK